jgi:hypothetical protein
MITCPLCQKLVLPTPSLNPPYLLGVEDDSPHNFECPTMVMTSPLWTYRSHFVRQRTDFFSDDNPSSMYRYNITVPPFQLIWETSVQLCTVYDLDKGGTWTASTGKYTITSLEAAVELANRLSNLKVFL